MIEPEYFIKSLFDTFDQSSIADFREFLSSNPNVTKWMIAADFCLHDKEKPNDTFAFSIIPYDNDFSSLKSEIKNALPKDLKKTRDIEDKAKSFLSSPRRFHLGFVFKDAPNVFNNGPDVDQLTVARESLTLSVAHLTKMGRSAENLRSIRMLLQDAQAKRFNVQLLADLFILSYLLCFVTLLLARERKSTVIGWFPDRDKMTTWGDGVLWDIGNETLLGLAERLSITLPKGAPTIGVPAPGENGPMWFDEFVRIPDYIAGILATWDFDKNALLSDRVKYQQLAQDVIADAKNIAVIRVRYDDIVECARVVFRRSETTP